MPEAISARIGYDVGFDYFQNGDGNSKPSSPYGLGSIRYPSSPTLKSKPSGLYRSGVESI